jgi:hypothetical protein
MGRAWWAAACGATAAGEGIEGHHKTSTDGPSWAGVRLREVS